MTIPIVLLNSVVILSTGVAAFATPESKSLPRAKPKDPYPCDSLSSIVITSPRMRARDLLFSTDHHNVGALSFRLSLAKVGFENVGVLSGGSTSLQRGE